jgi:hypothetical protein
MSKVARDRGLGNFKSQFQELAVDPGSTQVGFSAAMDRMRSRGSGFLAGPRALLVEMGEREEIGF